MAKDLELRVRIGADLDELKRALQGLQREVGQVRETTQKNSKALSSSFDGVKRSVVGLVASFATLATAKQFVDMADQVAMLDARLKLVTKTSGEFVKAQGALFDIANSTRSSLSDTVNLYARVARSTKDLAVSQDTLLAVTETVNQAVQLSGASAESANAALIQLGQGLASGTLRGEELNSVLEQTPRLAEAIATGMGTEVGKLKELAQAGKLTAEEVVNALVAQRQAVDSEFAQLPVTVGQAMQQVRNATLQAAGDMNKATGATAGLSNIIQGFAGWLNSGTLQEAFLGAFGYMTAFLSDLAQDFSQAFDIISSAHKDAFAEMGIDRDAYVGAMVESVKFVLDAWGTMPTNIRAFIQVIVTEAAYMFDRVALSAKTFKDKVAAIFTDDTMAEAEERFQQELANIKDARDQSITAILQERDAHFDAAAAAKDRYRTEKEAREKAAKTVGEPGRAVRKASATGEAAAVDEFRVLQENIKGQLAALDAAYKDAEISTTNYYARRRDLQLQALDAELADKQNAMAKAGDAEAKGKAMTDIAILQQKRQQLIAENTREQVAAEGDLQQQLADIRARAMAAEGNKVEARKLELQKQYKDLLARLKAEGNTAGVEMIQKLINTELAQTQFDDIRDKHQKLLDDLRTKEESYANQVRIGGMTQARADQLLQADRASARTAGAGLISQAQGLAQQNPGNAGIQGGLADLHNNQGQLLESATGLSKAYQDLSASLYQFEQQTAANVANTATDILANGLYNLMTGAKSAKQAFTEMAQGFVQAIAKMAAEWLAKKAILSILGSFGGPGGAAAGVGGGGGGVAGVFHTGGIAGMGGTIRRVPALAFAGAPRYHSGGVAGLKPGEVPAILKRGEEVLTQSDPRHAANGGGQGGGGTRVINVVDPNLVADYMSSSQGEQIFVNIIQRNAGVIRQAMA